MKIYTNPINKHLIDKVIQDQQKKDEEWGYHRPFGFKIIFHDEMPAERATGRWLVLGNKFFTWHEGPEQPPSWAIYCGFVKAEMEPYFIIQGDDYAGPTFSARFQQTFNVPKNFKDYKFPLMLGNSS